MAGQFESTPQQRWKVVHERRDALAEMIDKAAKAQPRTVRGRLRAVSQFLRRDGSYDGAIVRPDVIAFTQPLLVSGDQPTLSDEQLAWAASNGLNSLSYQPATIERLSQLMIYPTMIALASFGIYLGFSFFVAPEFEQMFYEFGIELPALTSGCLLYTSPSPRD